MSRATLTKKYHKRWLELTDEQREAQTQQIIDELFLGDKRFGRKIRKDLQHFADTGDLTFTIFSYWKEKSKGY
ncbi:MAG: hypothetical protein D6712_17770 [Chloroflexi bacterium]|nr:MAG: hypothetical protein D6712_17770 [Chloroflexota bacterium]